MEHPRRFVEMDHPARRIEGGEQGEQRDIGQPERRRDGSEARHRQRKAGKDQRQAAGACCVAANQFGVNDRTRPASPFVMATRCGKDAFVPAARVDSDMADLARRDIDALIACGRPCDQSRRERQSFDKIEWSRCHDLRAAPRLPRAVAEREHLTRAAGHLNLTPSAVSASIRARLSSPMAWRCSTGSAVASSSPGGAAVPARGARARGAGGDGGGDARRSRRPPAWQPGAAGEPDHRRPLAAAAPRPLPRGASGDRPRPRHRQYRHWSRRRCSRARRSSASSRASWTCRCCAADEVAEDRAGRRRRARPSPRSRGGTDVRPISPRRPGSCARPAPARALPSPRGSGGAWAFDRGARCGARASPPTRR